MPPCLICEVIYMHLNNGIIITPKTIQAEAWLRHWRNLVDPEIPIYENRATGEQNFEICHLVDYFNIRKMMLSAFNIEEEKGFNIKSADDFETVIDVFRYFLDSDRWHSYHETAFWSWHKAVRDIGDSLYKICEFVIGMDQEIRYEKLSITFNDFDIFFYDYYTP